MWYAVYDRATGRLVSTGTVLGDFGDEYEVSEYADRPDRDTRWDATTKTFVPLPDDHVVDRIQDLANHPYAAEVWSRLTVAQRQKLRKIFIWLLGTHRYRTPTEEVALDPDEGWPTDPGQAVE
jgi:hypothetical protein